jgi:hypothetical protein
MQVGNLLKFGPKREEVTTYRRKLHNDELHNFYSSPNIITVFKSKMMKWEWHVARIGKEKNAYFVIGEKVRRKWTTRKTKT